MVVASKPRSRNSTIAARASRSRVACCLRARKPGAAGDFPPGDNGLALVLAGFEAFKSFHHLQSCTQCTFRPVAGHFQPRRSYGMTDWTTADIPSLSGKTAVVTGATGGLGYE